MTLIHFAQLVYLFFVVLLTALGVFVIGADVVAGGQLHFTNAIVGGLALVIAVALAIPLRLKDALALVAPYLDKWRIASESSDG